MLKLPEIAEGFQAQTAGHIGHVREQYKTIVAKLAR